jgi:molecular chaperone GrpE
MTKPDFEPEKEPLENEEQAQAGPTAGHNAAEEAQDADDDGAGDDLLQVKIEALEAELDRTKDQMLRALADADNTRKRAKKERADTSRYAISAFAKDLLDFSDNFRRAIDSFPQELADSDNEPIRNMLSGLEAMEREILSTFAKHGITKLEPMGEIFDPNFHEVMFEAPAEDRSAGTIIQLIEPGYMLHDRLLRPARVGVARHEGPGGSQDDPAHRIDQEA